MVKIDDFVTDSGLIIPKVNFTPDQFLGKFTEIRGPAKSGKTTLACAIADAIRTHIGRLIVISYGVSDTKLYPETKYLYNMADKSSEQLREFLVQMSDIVVKGRQDPALTGTVLRRLLRRLRLGGLAADTLAETRDGAIEQVGRHAAYLCREAEGRGGLTPEERRAVEAAERCRPILFVFEGSTLAALRHAQSDGRISALLNGELGRGAAVVAITQASRETNLPFIFSVYTTLYTRIDIPGSDLGAFSDKRPEEFARLTRESEAIYRDGRGYAEVADLLGGEAPIIPAYYELEPRRA